MTTGEVSKKQIIGTVLALIVALSSVFVSYALDRNSSNSEAIKKELKQKVDITTFKEAMTEYDKQVIGPIKKDIEDLKLNKADKDVLNLILEQLKEIRQDIRQQNKD